MAVVSKSKNAVLFMESIRSLILSNSKEQFERFSTLSIFDAKYPTVEAEAHTTNPPVLLYYQGILIY